MEWGDGPPLIILHGLFGMSDNWAPLARKLSNGYRVIVPDLRNHGRSPHFASHTYKEMASDITILCNELNIDRCSILGHSMGGKVAMTLAFDNPALVDRLVVADIGPGAYPDHSYHSQLIQLMLDAHPETASNRSEIESRLASEVFDERIRLFLLKNITRDQNGSFAWKVNLPVLAACMPQILAGVTPNGFYSGKSLFVKGELSDYVSGHQCDLIYEQFPTARVVAIQKAGHWLHADAPEEFFRVVSDFLFS